MCGWIGGGAVGVDLGGKMCKHPSARSTCCWANNSCIHFGHTMVCVFCQTKFCVVVGGAVDVIVLLRASFAWLCFTRTLRLPLHMAVEFIFVWQITVEPRRRARWASDLCLASN